MPLKIVIYTDLDGTLLDHSSYSFTEASPALHLAKSQGVPVILCSSKTRAEIEVIRRRLTLGHPFVVENGGAIYIPKSYFSEPIPASITRDDFCVVELGIPYSRLVSALDKLAGELGLEVKGFHQMSVEEVATECGLPLEAARQAKLREYDEPFTIKNANEDTLERVSKAAISLGLALTRGGRYFHLLGGNDKGPPVALLTTLFHRQNSKLFTIGLGDSRNDLAMLQEVDCPILVQKPDGSYDEEIRKQLPGVHLAEGAGPKGWNAAVAALLESRHALIRGYRL
jgi:mannosyl-3-phosphoglycerate phosphatase